MQIRFTRNMLSIMQKPQACIEVYSADSPLALHAKSYLFPPDQYAQESERIDSLLRFNDRTTGKSFCLEVKTCTADWMHQIKWCTGLQLKRYLSCHKKVPTFLLLEMDGGSNRHQNLYLLSMTQACHVYLVDTSIMHCKISADEPVSSKLLWSR